MPTLVHVHTAWPTDYLYSPVEVCVGEKAGRYLGLWDTAAPLYITPLPDQPLSC